MSLFSHFFSFSFFFSVSFFLLYYLCLGTLLTLSFSHYLCLSLSFFLFLKSLTSSVFLSLCLFSQKISFSLYLFISLSHDWPRNPWSPAEVEKWWKQYLCIKVQSLFKQLHFKGLFMIFHFYYDRGLEVMKTISVHQSLISVQTISFKGFVHDI